jgi:hypothetical protein
MEHFNEQICAACESRFAGKMFAYATSHVRDLLPGMPAGWVEGHDWRLTIVVDGESGHYPLSPFVAHGTETEMQELANRLNRDRLKLPVMTAMHLIAQSMRSEGRR